MRLWLWPSTLSSFRFQCLEPLAEGLQIMARPDAADSAGRNEESLFSSTRGRPNLA
jgi:hypothetical protein